MGIAHLILPLSVTIMKISTHQVTGRMMHPFILLFNIYWISFVYQTRYQTLGIPKGSRSSTYLQRTPSYPKGNSYLLGGKESWPFRNFSQLGQCFSNWIVHVNPPEILLRSRSYLSGSVEGGPEILHFYQAPGRVPTWLVQRSHSEQQSSPCPTETECKPQKYCAKFCVF